MIFLSTEQLDKRERSLTKIGDFLQKDEPNQTEGAIRHFEQKHLLFLSKQQVLFIYSFSAHN